MIVQEGSVIEYLNFRIFQSPVGFSIDQTDHIMELVNKWLPSGKFRKVDTTFWTRSSYEKELLAALTLTGHALHKVEMEYYGKFVHTLGRIQHIALMSRIDRKRCVQYLASHPHTPIFHTSDYYEGSSFIRLTWVPSA